MPSYIGYGSLSSTGSGSSSVCWSNGVTFGGTPPTFEVGDVVCFKTDGVLGTIKYLPKDNYSSDLYAVSIEGGRKGGGGKDGYWNTRPDEIVLITKYNTNKKMSITENFKMFFKSEPEKSYRKAGIINGDDMITCEGSTMFVTWLLKKNPDFLKEVVTPLLESDKKSE